MTHFLLCLSLLSAQASPTPNMYIDKDYRYRIADVYNAADLVVIARFAGKSGDNLRMKVVQVVKGKAGDEVVVRGQVAVNTEWNGYSLPEKTDLLLLMKKVGDVYERVEGFNSGGPIYYPVIDGAVIMAGKNSHYKKPLAVPVKRIRKYFESKPETLWMQ